MILHARPGAVLQSIVSVQIAHGLVDLNKILKQAAVRRHVVLQLIRMLKDSGDEDYQDVDMQDVSRRCADLADTDDPTVPQCIFSLLGDIKDDDTSATDKSAMQSRIRLPHQQSVFPQQNS